MRRFTDKALLLMASRADYAEYSSAHTARYKQAVHNLIRYLKDNGVAHHCLISDGLAGCLNMENALWLATGAPEDMFFMQNYCGVPTYPTTPLAEYLVATVRKRFPIERGTEASDRFKIVSKRVAFVEKELIASYKFVAVFGDAFKVKSKEGDGRAVMRINDKRLSATLLLSNTEIPIVEFLQLPYGSQCLCDWGRYNGDERQSSCL